MNYKMFEYLLDTDTDIKSDIKSDIKINSKGKNVKDLQIALEKLGFKLFIYGVDSIFGNETLSKVKSLFSFLKKDSEFKEYVDDMNLLEINNNTVTSEQQELIMELAEDDDLKNEISSYFKEVEDKINKSDVIGKKEIYRNIENPDEFITKVKTISKSLNINPNWLLLVMWKESRINPKALNKDGGASGLIQFIPSTAKGLGTTIEDIRNMDAIEQLDYVYKYFKPFIGKLNSAQDLYLVTFLPVALGKEDDFVLQAKGLSPEKIASSNPAIDLNRDGEIKKSEFDEYVLKGVPDSWKDKL